MALGFAFVLGFFAGYPLRPLVKKALRAYLLAVSLPAPDWMKEGW